MKGISAPEVNSFEPRESVTLLQGGVDGTEPQSPPSPPDSNCWQ